MLKRIKLWAVLWLIAGHVHAEAANFSLSSSAIPPDSTLNQNQVFNGFGCEGKNISPPLKWSNPPAGTKSFALTVYDPDAPTGSGWWHWLVYNLPATVSDLAENAGKSSNNLLPKGAIQGKNDFGIVDFGGACPPQGDKPHHYVFTIYALKIEKIALPEDASAAMIGFTLNANQLGKATLTAKFGR